MNMTPFKGLPISVILMENPFTIPNDYNSNLTSIQSSDGLTTYDYDKLNRIQKVQLSDGSQIDYRYDLMGRVTHLTYPDSEVVEYQYDERGRLVKIKEAQGETSYEYDDLTGLVVKEILPNGVSTNYAYDTFPHILEVCHRDPYGTLLIHFSYEYNERGYIAVCREKAPSKIKVTCYSYDALDRLDCVEDDTGSYEKYTYDEAGNRLLKTTEKETIHYRYDRKNRLIQAGNTSYEYDIAGNLIKKTSPDKQVSYSYDPTGKLVAYSDGENHVEFRYDGQGKRSAKVVNGSITYFINDPNASISRVLLEKDSKGKVRKKYIYGHSRIIQKGEHRTHYFLYDQPGKSISHLISHDGTEKLSMQYEPFGLPLSQDLESSYGYNGEEYDPETGLIFLRNRYYDPEVGRFISPDFVYR